MNNSVNAPCTATDALNSLRKFHELMRPGERFERVQRWRYRIALLIPPVLPLLLIAVIAMVATEPMRYTPGTSLSSQTSELENRVEDHLTAETVNDPESLDALRALSAERTRRAAGDAVGRHSLYRAQISLLAAIFVLLFLSVALVWQQNRIIQRHQSTFWREDTVKHPWVIMTGCILYGIGLYYIPSALPWLFETSGSNIALLTTLIVGTIVAGLIFYAIYVTAHLTRLLAWNFPDVALIEEIRAVLAQPVITVKPDTQEVKAVPIQSGSMEVVPPEQTVITLFEKHRDELTEGALVDRALGATATVTVVNATATTLAVVLVTAIVVVALGLDLFEMSVVGPAELRSAVAASNNDWLLVLGIAFSLALAAIYVPALVRLYPYASASSDFSTSEIETGWVIKGSIPPTELHRLKRNNNIELTLVKPAPKPQIEFSPELQWYLGTDIAKFREIMRASTYGGGFHQLLQDTLKTQITRILGLLSPALAGSLLNVIG